MKTDQNESSRRMSISTLHHSMFQKLLDAEAEHESQLKSLHEQNKELERELKLERIKNDLDTTGQDSNQSLSILGGDLQRSASPGFIESPLFPSTPVGPDTDDPRLLKKEIKNLATERKVLQNRIDSEAEVHAKKEEEYLSKIEELQGKMSGATQSVKAAEQNRRDSISATQNTMVSKLLNSEFEYEEEVERLKGELEERTSELMDARGRLYEYQSQPVSNIPETGGGMESQTMQLLEDREEYKKELKNAEHSRKESISFLSERMMTKLLQAEEDHETELEIWKGKLRALEGKLKESELLNETLDMTRRNSVTAISQNMFQKLLAAEQEKQMEKETLEEEISRLKDELLRERFDKQQSEMQRRGTVSTLHTSMFKKLLEAEVGTYLSLFSFSLLLTPYVGGARPSN